MTNESQVIEWPELPDWGAYLQWPEAGTQWIHPDDVDLVQRLIPSNRVFLRSGFDGMYYLLSYGEFKLRVKPTLWTKLEDDGFRIGDMVEVDGVDHERESMIATIGEKRFNVETHTIGYTLIHRELPIDRIYLAAELKSLMHRVELRQSDGNIVRPIPADLDDTDLRIETDSRTKEVDSDV